MHLPRRYQPAGSLYKADYPSGHGFAQRSSLLKVTALKRLCALGVFTALDNLRLDLYGDGCCSFGRWIPRTSVQLRRCARPFNTRERRYQKYILGLCLRFYD